MSVEHFNNKVMDARRWSERWIHVRTDWAYRVAWERQAFKLVALVESAILGGLLLVWILSKV